jgi:hypothetical protein
MVKSKRMIEAKWADRKEEWARKLELVDNLDFRKDYNTTMGFGLITGLVLGYSASVAIMTGVQYAYQDWFLPDAWVRNLAMAGILGIAGVALAVGTLYLNWKLMDKKWGV